MKFFAMGLLALLVLQGCAASGNGGGSSAIAGNRPTAAGMTTGGCQDVYGRTSPYSSCRDS